MALCHFPFSLFHFLTATSFDLLLTHGTPLSRNLRSFASVHTE